MSTVTLVPRISCHSILTREGEEALIAFTQQEGRCVRERGVPAGGRGIVRGSIDICLHNQSDTVFLCTGIYCTVGSSVVDP
jgi:hypothetical protein